MMSCSGAVYMVKISGPRTDAWGTPYGNLLAQTEMLPLNYLAPFFKVCTEPGQCPFKVCTEPGQCPFKVCMEPGQCPC